MAVLRNGKPIDEVELPQENGYERMLEMRQYRRQRGWGGEATLQSSSHHASDTPRNWKHNRNIRA
jgi:hypothetical protein